MSGIVLGAGDTTTNKREKVPVFMELIYLLVKERVKK